MVKLGINIDHIATLRQARLGAVPSVLEAAKICENSGAEGITVHLREDRRHIQDKDVYDLRKSIQTKLNLEMAACEEIVKIALDVKPDDVCIVPEKRLELTTEGGLNVKNQKEKISDFTGSLKNAGICVSLFIDPDMSQVEAAKEVGADCIELHTGAYAENYFDKIKREEEFKKIKEASSFASSLGLVLNAGHGLDYNNVKDIVSIENINELNIGFSIIARAVFIGLDNAVKEMKGLLSD